MFEQFRALLTERKTHLPPGCHRSRVPERVVFEKLVEVLVEVLIFGCAYERIADETCSESTLRRRRNEWIELGLMEWLREICLEAHDRLVGLEPSEVAVDCCVTKAPRVGERVFIPRGTVHRLSTAGEEVRILEISFGEFDEEDIVRLDAVYGRVAQ